MGTAEQYIFQGTVAPSGVGGHSLPWVGSAVDPLSVPTIMSLEASCHLHPMCGDCDFGLNQTR